MSFIGQFGALPETGGGGGGGVTEYATVAELITASQGSLAAGFYEVPGVVLVEWDGSAFSERLSVVQDHLDDVAIWLDKGGQILEGANARAWKAADLADSAVGYSDRTMGTIGTAPAVTFAGSGWTTADRAAYDVAGAFELFATIELANDTQSNAGIAGKWNGSNGWILFAAHFAGTFGVSFGINGTYAIAGSRLGTDPHVVHARYTGTDLVISVDGVDLDTAAFTGTNDNAGSLSIGSYQGATYGFSGTMAHFLKVNKLLSSGERAAIVAEMMAEIGI
jgi:hypothetical protein